MVTFATLALIVYGLIALVFLENTFREGHVRERAWDMPRVAGLLLCLVWPLLLIGIVILARFQRASLDRQR